MLKSIRSSKRTQFLLIVLAGLVSFLPLTAMKRQGNSIRWSVDGDQIRCEYFQLPSFSHVRAYALEKVEGVTKAADSTDPSLDVVRLQLEGLNLNIPSQSSALIWNFEGYIERLQAFFERVKSGDRGASLAWYHPWLVVAVCSGVLAVLLWVFVFAVLLLGPPKVRPAPGAELP